MVSQLIQYAIVNTETGEFWKNKRGRAVWGRKIDAINSWNADGYWPRLSEQNLWKVVPVTLLTLGWS